MTGGPTDLEHVRRFALALPEASEQPHFDMISFRVRGKIFATVPPGEQNVHVFIDESEVRASVAEDPGAFEPLVWGRNLKGLRINLRRAQPARVRELIEESWRRKAPARLAAQRAPQQPPASR